MPRHLIAMLTKNRQTKPLPLSHPDYTVGSGISPDLLTLLKFKRRSRALSFSEDTKNTAGQEFHPALSTSYLLSP